MGTVELALIVDGIRCHHLLKSGRGKERRSEAELVNTVRGVVAPGTVHEPFGGTYDCEESRNLWFRIAVNQ